MMFGIITPLCPSGISPKCKLLVWKRNKKRKSLLLESRSRLRVWNDAVT
jgi:hypothetical protein